MTIRDLELEHTELLPSEPETPSLAGCVAGGRGVPAGWGAELFGAYRDSAYGQPPSLARRPDGQFIQMPVLLNRAT